MKKILPLILVVLVVVGVWSFASSRQSASNVSPTSEPTPATKASSGMTSEAEGAKSGETSPIAQGEALPSLEDGESLAEVKPAAEVYKSADEALAAVEKAAKDYDDTVLEQFTQPGEDCTWCPDFYRSVRGVLASGDTPQDQKSYLAEILAISGRVENVQALVEAIKGAKTPEEADLYSEALELSVGKDDVARYLGDQMASANETLREASVAAVTNQGSRLAAEMLIKHTTERGDSDGYYSLGIGLGEFIPDEEAMPLLQDMMHKHDQYSHLAVKSLINGGMDGLRTVFDELETSRDVEMDRKMLKDAIDHVNFEDGLEEYLRQKIATSKQPVVTEFAKKILDEFSQQEGDQASATPVVPN